MVMVKVETEVMAEMVVSLEKLGEAPVLVEPQGALTL